MRKNKPLKIKICGECRKEFNPNSGNQLYCDNCKEGVQRRKSLERYYKNGRKQSKKIYDLNGRRIYLGQKGENNNNYKNNIGNYQKIGMQRSNCCEYCNSKSNLLVHHYDEDMTNNKIENLRVMCKKCHQNRHCLRDKTTGRFIKQSSV